MSPADERSGCADVAIVVPAYNAGPFVEACLRSVMAQSFTAWTCIVVDDGSTDDTLARVQAVDDPRIVLIRQANGGVSRARNNGLARASTPFVMFLDADDLLHPTALERLLQGLADAPQAVAAFGPLRKVLANGAPYPGEKPLSAVRYPDGDVLERMVQENFLANGGQVLIRREAARTVGGFDPGVRLSEDWVFWCRLALLGPFHYVGNAAEIFSLRMSAESASGALSADWANHQPALAKVLDDPQIAARFTPAAWTRLRRQVLASHMWEAGRVNFTFRRFAEARRLMLGALVKDPRPKRLALFVLAQLSQATGRPLASRLRFRTDDQHAATTAS